MNWYLVLENSVGDKSIYLTGTREEMLLAIELMFENGALSGKKYIKKTLSMWQYLDRDKLHLVNDKGLEKLGHSESNRSA